MAAPTTVPRELILHVHEATALPEAEPERRRNPVFKLFVDGENVFESDAECATTEPKWQSCQLLPSSDAVPNPRAVFIEVWDRDDLASSSHVPDRFLGCATLQLEADVVNASARWLPLQPHPTHRAENKVQGSVKVSVRTIPKKRRTIDDVTQWVETVGFRPDDAKEIQKAFRFHHVNSRVLDRLSKTGVDLQRYGITNVSFCATLAIEWRKAKAEQRKIFAEVDRSRRAHAERAAGSQGLPPPPPGVEDTEGRGEEEEEEEDEAAGESRPDKKVHAAAAAFRRFIGNLLIDHYQVGEYLSEDAQGQEEAPLATSGRQAAEEAAEEAAAPTDGTPHENRLASLASLASSDLEHAEDEKAREEKAFIELHTDDLIMARAEILESEKTYVRNLTTLEECFHKPMRQWWKELPPEQQGEAITQDELNTLFGHITMILDVNRKLLADLSTEYFLGGNLGEVFKTFAPFLRMYCAYVESYENHILALVPELRKRPLLAAFLRCAELQARCNGAPLQRFLSLPVHRIPQYKLLLREVVKHTPLHDGNPRYLSLSKAYQEISDVAEYVNASLHRNTRLAREAELRVEWNFRLMDGAARQLVREDSITKVYSNGKTSTKRVLLLSDMLAYGDDVGLAGGAKGQLYALRKTFPLRNAVALDGQSKDDMALKSQVKMVKQLGMMGVLNGLDATSFVLVTPESSVVRFRLETSVDKDSWLVDVRNAIAEAGRLREEGGPSPSSEDQLDKKKRSLFSKLRSPGSSLGSSRLSFN